MYASQQQPQFPYEQQMPSTSYAAGFNAPPMPSFSYRNQPPGYFQPNTNQYMKCEMRVPYPQGQSPANGGMLRSESGIGYPTRPQMDRKMLNTQEWMKNHRFVAATQEQCRPGSASPSVISRFTQMSVATDVSMSSVQSLLSDVHRLEELRRFHPVVPSASSSCVENIDPRNAEYERTATACLDNICNIIEESIAKQDKASLRSAIDSLFVITKHCDFNVASGYSLEALMLKLVDLITNVPPANLEPEMSAIMEKTLSAISRMLAFEKVRTLMKKWDLKSLLKAFIPWIISTEKFCLFVLTTIHSLVEITYPKPLEKETKETIILKLLDVMNLMHQRGSNYFLNTPKKKQYVFVLVRHIFFKEEALKLLFVSKNGMELLLHFLKNEQDESTIYRIIYVVASLVSTNDQTVGLRFLNLQGLELLARIADRRYQNYHVVEHALRSLRAVSDIDQVRMSDNSVTISYVAAILERYRSGLFDLNEAKCHPSGCDDTKCNISNCMSKRFKYFCCILNLGVEFLGNIAALSKNVDRNQNKDSIVQNQIIIPYMVTLLAFCKRSRLRWKELEEIDTLISRILWALRVFIGVSAKDLLEKASNDLLCIPEAAELFVHELAGNTNLSCRYNILNILVGIVQGNKFGSPPRLRNVKLQEGNSSFSIANILFDIIDTTVQLKEPMFKKLAKGIILKSYELLVLLADSDFDFGNEIRYVCPLEKMAGFLWSVVEDADLVKNTLEFIGFVAAEEQFRECFSRDAGLSSAIRHVFDQGNENTAAAQGLLFSLQFEIPLSGTILML